MSLKTRKLNLPDNPVSSTHLASRKAETSSNSHVGSCWYATVILRDSATLVSVRVCRFTLVHLIEHGILHVLVLARLPPSALFSIHPFRSHILLDIPHNTNPCHRRHRHYRTSDEIGNSGSIQLCCIRHIFGDDKTFCRNLRSRHTLWYDTPRR